MNSDYKLTERGTLLHTKGLEYYGEVPLKFTLPLQAIGAFTGLYLAVAASFAFTTGNAEFLYYIGVIVVLGLLALWLHSRVRLSHGVLWALSVWGLLHMVGGLVPVPEGWPIKGDIRVCYSWWVIPGFVKYDHLIHAYGFGIATWLCWQAARPQLQNQSPRLGILALCVLAAAGLGAVNEIVEFLAVVMIPNTNVGGYVNTALDLVSNSIGAVIAAVLIRLFSH